MKKKQKDSPINKEKAPQPTSLKPLRAKNPKGIKIRKEEKEYRQYKDNLN